MKHLRKLVAIVVVSLSSTPIHAQHFPANEDLRQLRNVSSPHLSPNGMQVLVEVQDSTADGGYTHLWLLNNAGPAYSQVRFPGFASSTQKNSQFLDDHTVLFTTGGKLYRIDLATQGPIPIEISISRATNGVVSSQEIDSYVISPDGSSIAVITEDPTRPEIVRESEERRDFTWVNHEGPGDHLYLVRTKDWKVAEVPHVQNIDGLSWASTSDRFLLLTHTRPPEFGPSTAPWIVHCDDPSIQERVSGLPKATYSTAWLHDGTGLVVFAQRQRDAAIGSSDLYTYTFATHKLRHFDAGLSDSTFSIRTTVIVADDDRSLLVGITHGTRWTVGRVDLQRDRLERYDLGMPTVTDFSQGGEKQSRGWVYVGTSSTALPAVYLVSKLPSVGRRLAQPDLTPSDWQAVAAKVVTWSRAGVKLEGLLYMPPQKNSLEHVPMIVIAHGGPTGQFTDSYVPLVNLLVREGWAVFLPNPRGSTGYGATFEALNKRDLGNGDFLDIMAGVDRMIRTEPIDASRMAFIGHSYGGIMACFVEGKTNRFKAIVASDPVADQISEQGTADESYPDTWFTGLPWKDFQLAWRQSPLAYAANAKTPLLLLHGQSDSSDPPSQSMEMYHALRVDGVPVQLLLFPREGHGAMGRHFYGQPSTEPWHGVIIRDHILNFIKGSFQIAPPAP